MHDKSLHTSFDPNPLASFDPTHRWGLSKLRGQDDD